MRPDKYLINFYVNLFKTCLNTSNDKKVMAKLIMHLSGQDDIKFIEETYKFDPFDKKNIIKILPLFIRIADMNKIDVPAQDDENNDDAGG